MQKNKNNTPLPFVQHFLWFISRLPATSGKSSTTQLTQSSPHLFIQWRLKNLKKDNQKLSVFVITCCAALIESISSVDGETSRIMALLSSPACLQMHSNSSSVGHAWMWSDFKPWNFKPTRVRELWEGDDRRRHCEKGKLQKKKKKKEVDYCWTKKEAFFFWTWKRMV